jgi:hypothetical protein
MCLARAKDDSVINPLLYKYGFVFFSRIADCADTS